MIGCLLDPVGSWCDLLHWCEIYTVNVCDQVLRGGRTARHNITVCALHRDEAACVTF